MTTKKPLTAVKFPLAIRKPTETLPFTDYLLHCRHWITKRRLDLHEVANPEHLVEANSPFAYYPPVCQSHAPLRGHRYQYGALLIHGLLDCPFTMREIAAVLQQHQIPSHAVLLPGHGTHPTDLSVASYEDWRAVVRYGIASLRGKAATLFLIGFSTGAVLAIDEALQDETIAGIILLAPAMQLQTTLHFMIHCYHTLTRLPFLHRWLKQSMWGEHTNKDYVKYSSIALQGVDQLLLLTKQVNQLINKRPFPCPLFMILSQDDQTISNSTALKVFKACAPENSQLLWYGASLIEPMHKYPVIQRTLHAIASTRNINHLPHAALPFSPQNPHYGIDAKPSMVSPEHTWDQLWSYWLHQINLTPLQHRYLTFNPDFNFMATKIVEFIQSTPNDSGCTLPK